MMEEQKSIIVEEKPDIVTENPGPTYMKSFIIEMKEFREHVKLEARKNFFYDTQSEKIDKITKALTEFMLEMPKMKADKSAMGRFRYQSLASMLEKINPVLAKFGCKCLQPTHTLGEITYIITKVTHVSGQYFRSVTAIPSEYIRAGKTVKTASDLQAMGGAQTYVKRYALKSMLGIDADDDN